jgi:hypothetical protein
MTKITLDEVEYDTEDFSEDQNKMLNELIANKNVAASLKYQLNGVSIVADLLLKKLKETLVTETVDDD